MTGLPEEPQEAREGGPRLQAVAQGMQMTAAGGFYLITFISAIPAVFLLDPVLNDPNYM